MATAGVNASHNGSNLGLVRPVALPANCDGEHQIENSAESRACEPRDSLVAVRLREARVAAHVGDQESKDLRSHGRAGSVSHLGSYEIPEPGAGD